MRIEPEFPANRRGVAAYAGVEQAYDQVAASAAPGQAIYYPDAGPTQPDFLIAQEGVAFTFLKVTTDPHTVEDDRLMVNPGNGQPAVSSPLGATAAKSVGVSKQVAKELGLTIFVIPALALLSQTVEPAVRAWGERHKVKLLDQDDNIVDRMSACVTSGEFEVFSRPMAAEIEAVVEFLRPEPVAEEAEAAAAAVAVPADAPAPAPAALGLSAHKLVIHSITVNVYNTGAAATSSGPELPDGG